MTYLKKRMINSKLYYEITKFNMIMKYLMQIDKHGSRTFEHIILWNMEHRAYLYQSTQAVVCLSRFWMTYKCVSRNHTHTHVYECGVEITLTSIRLTLLSCLPWVGQIISRTIFQHYGPLYNRVLFLCWMHISRCFLINCHYKKVCEETKCIFLIIY